MSVFAALDQSITLLQQSKVAWSALPIARKIALLRASRTNLAQCVDRLASLSAEHKGVDPASSMAGDEWVLGPWSAAYSISTLIASLEDLAAGGMPSLTRTPRPTGGTAVQVFPTNLFEKLLVNGLTAEVWCNEDGHSCLSTASPAVALVLGAGNVASIPILDTIHKLYAENQVVALKLNPVNDYLEPLLSEIFAPFINANFVVIIKGGADVGEYLVRHPGIDEIHITGSARTHDAIVFGAGEEGQQRKRSNAPQLKKRITSELGGVCPVIVVPGAWTAADVRFQAENIVSQRLYHNGYNCCASQVLVLPEDWKYSDALMAAIRHLLKTLPPRHPYYPGSHARQHAAAQAHPSAEMFAPDPLRTLIADVPPAAGAHVFAEEAFCPVLAQTALPAPDVETYLKNAVSFANESLSGTLSATVLIDPIAARTHAAALDAAITALRYGSVGINIWAAGGFMLPGAAWGAYPGHTAHNIGSGIGTVHNAYLLKGGYKTVLRGAFRQMPRAWLHGDFNLMPKPLWFVTNKNALETARRVTCFSLDPGWKQMPGLLLAALRG